jgi:hypothetical protein
LSEDLAEKRLGEASLLKKIAELEEANTNLKIEKESMAAGYHRLADKYKDVEAKVKAIEKEKVEVEKSCTTQVAEVGKKLVKEVEDYKDYRLKFWQSLHTLHEIFVYLLGEIGARFLPFPPKRARFLPFPPKSAQNKNDTSSDSITFGDNSQGKVHGYGKIAITTEHSISKVLLVESLDYNLLSVLQFCEMGYNYLFTNKGVIVFRRSNGSFAFKCVLRGKLYLVNFIPKEVELDKCLIAKRNMGWLWQCRLAHIGMRNLHKLQKRGPNSRTNQYCL